MRLTSFTDYALRSLIYLGQHSGGLATIQEIAELHGISKNHLMKVVNHLGQGGYVDTVRGRHGGLRLARAPGTIKIGDVVRYTESDFFMAECFGPHHSACAYAGACVLKGALGRATSAYLAVLDDLTLADLLAPQQRQHTLLRAR